MGGKSAPPSPDYSAVAKQQGADNRDTAIAQSNLNNPNMITPYGTSQYSGPADGTGRGTLTQTLAPAEQAKLDASNAAQLSSLGILNADMPNISKALGGSFGMAGSAATGYDPRFPIGQTQSNLDPNSAGGLQRSLNFKGSPGLVGTDQATRAQAQDATYKQGAQYLDPQYKNLSSDLATKLGNQGITAGSAAYDRAQREFSDTRQRAYSDLGSTAIRAGNDALAQQQQAALANRGQISGETAQSGQFANSAQQQAFNAILQSMQANNAGVAQQANIAQNSTQLVNAGRAQNYSEYSANRTMPINMLNALISSSQVNNPTFQPTAPTAITPAPLMQGAISQGQNDAANYSANQAKMGQMYSALGTGAGLAFKSDRRLKSNVVLVGKHGPFNLYEYNMADVWARIRGVMADEVEKIVPQAVSIGPDGYQRVNYDMIGLDADALADH